MSQTLQALDFLYTIERERLEGIRRVCALLPRQPATDFLECISVQQEEKLGSERFDATIEVVAETVATYKVQWSITDWPFENFWQNPNEPRHSRLLGYFIDPIADHGCGAFLLGKLLDTLKLSLPKDNWHVAVERRHIDILLTRECESGKHAIIVENKVNWATDQPDQLQTYVDAVHDDGFDYEDIYVLYLPLTSAKDPTDNSVGSIKDRTHYHKITFDKDILGWLTTVLDDEQEWPAGMRQGMRDNLAHYRNLVSYLIRQQKERIMNAEILQKLKTTSPLPNWSQVDSLARSANELKACVESVVRGKLLLRIAAFLVKMRRSGLCITFFDSSGVPIDGGLQSEYDQHFLGEVFLGVMVTEAVMACVGVLGGDGNGIVYAGYKKMGLPEQQDRVSEIALQVAKTRFSDNPIPYSGWYGYWYDKSVTYENATDTTTADSLARELLDMQVALCEAINRNETRP